jgi:hypothetical protein
MEWGALIGGLIGAGIPAILTYLGLRRTRQSTDAEAFGPALLLLDRLHPDRVAMNLRDADTEAATWVELQQQLHEARERLLVVSAGHPRRRVRQLAQDAQIKVANAFSSSQWVVGDMLRNRDNTEWMDHARQTHADATTAMRRLIDANFEWHPLQLPTRKRPRAIER